MKHNGFQVDGKSHNPKGSLLQSSVITIMKIRCIVANLFCPNKIIKYNKENHVVNHALSINLNFVNIKS